jgi:hypothetical protein
MQKLLQGDDENDDDIAPDVADTSSAAVAGFCAQILTKLIGQMELQGSSPTKVFSAENNRR